MTPEFKTDLQKLIDKAASKHIKESWANVIDGKSGFKAGCDFLMPLIEELIRQRDMHIPDTFGDGWDMIVSDNHNKQLLNLLRSEK